MQMKEKTFQQKAVIATILAAISVGSLAGASVGTHSMEQSNSNVRRMLESAKVIQVVNQNQTVRNLTTLTKNDFEQKIDINAKKVKEVELGVSDTQLKHQDLVKQGYKGDTYEHDEINILKNAEGNVIAFSGVSFADQNEDLSDLGMTKKDIMQNMSEQGEMLKDMHKNGRLLDMDNKPIPESALTQLIEQASDHFMKISKSLDLSMEKSELMYEGLKSANWSGVDYVNGDLNILKNDKTGDFKIMHEEDYMSYDLENNKDINQYFKDTLLKEGASEEIMDYRNDGYARLELPNGEEIPDNIIQERREFDMTAIAALINQTSKNNPLPNFEKEIDSNQSFSFNQGIDMLNKLNVEPDNYVIDTSEKIELPKSLKQETEMFELPNNGVKQSNINNQPDTPSINSPMRKPRNT